MSDATSDASPKPTPTPANRTRGLPPRAAAALRDATALLERGDFKSAESALLIAHFHAPDHPEVLRLSGMVQYREGRLQDAIDSFTRSLTARPDDAAVLTWLGAAQSDAREFAAAQGSLRRAADVASDADAFLNLGMEFARQGYSRDALDAANRVLGLYPNNAMARLLRARSRQSLGDAGAAASDYRALIAANQHVADAWASLVDLKPLRIDVEELAALERASTHPAFSEGERITLMFALGKAYEDHARYRDAFSTLTRANASVYATSGWQPQAFTRQVDAVRQAFADPVSGVRSRAGAEVIFLVGMPGSGSTLVEQILAAHTRVEGAGELPFLSLVIREESSRRRVPFPQWVRDSNPSDWERLGQDYLRMSARWRLERPVSTDKLPENWLLAGAALAMLPAAKVIDCRREAIETCWSCYRQMFAPGRAGFAYDLAALAEYWHGYDGLCRFWAQRYETQLRVQRYESLLADPDAEIRALLTFCELDFEPSCLRFYEARRAVRGPSAAQVRQPLQRDTARTPRYGELLLPLRQALASS